MACMRVFIIDFKGRFHAGGAAGSMVAVMMLLVWLVMGGWTCARAQGHGWQEPSEIEGLSLATATTLAAAGTASSLEMSGPSYRRTIDPAEVADSRPADANVASWLRFGLELGIFTALSFYCLILFASLREVSLLWCALTVLLLGAFFVSVHPLPRTYLNDVPAKEVARFAWVTIGIFFVALGYFSRSFLHSAVQDSELSRVDFLLWIFIAQGGVLVLLVYAGGARVSGPAILFMTSPSVVLLSAASLDAWHKGIEKARFLFGASVLAGAEAVAQVVVLSDDLPFPQAGSYLLEVGCMGVGLLLVCALGDRIGALQKEKEVLRVSERRHMLLAFTDGLTGLFNMRYFRTRLELEIRSAEQLDQPLTLMMMDIDNFKLFNDSFGHLEGDRVLRRLGELITKVSREDDVACRYGGEEFAVILPASAPHGAIDIHERLQQALQQWAGREKEGFPYLVTLSVGVAEHLPGEMADDLIARADAALYAAKEGGRNQLVMSDPCATVDEGVYDASFTGW